MTLPLEDYELQLRNMRVNGPIVACLKRIRRRIYEKKMVRLFRMQIRLKKSLFSDIGSFYNISGIQENNRFYYNRSQQHILDNFLALIA
jgi:hypothetical protein